MKKLMWLVAIGCLAVTTGMMAVMPDSVPMHYNAAGQIDRWGSKYENMLFPIMILAMAWLFSAIASHYEKKAAENPGEKAGEEARSNAKVLHIVGITVIILFAVMQGTILYAACRGAAEGASYWSVDISKVTYILMGILFIVLGNVMPKTKRNSTVGFRVSWSMYNDNTWRKCNRFGGYVMMAMGMLTVVTALVAGSIAMTVLLFVYLAAGLTVMLIYAHRVYRAECADERKN